MATKRDKFKMLNTLQNMLRSGDTDSETESDYKEGVHEIFMQSIKNNKNRDRISNLSKFKNGIQLTLLSPTKYDIRKHNNNLSHSNNETSFEDIISSDLNRSNQNDLKFFYFKKKAISNHKSWVNSILNSCYNQCST